MTWHHVTSALQGTLACAYFSCSFIEFRVCLNHRRFTLHVSSHTIQVRYIFTYIYHKNKPFKYRNIYYIYNICIYIYTSPMDGGHCPGFVFRCCHLGSKRTNGWRETPSGAKLGIDGADGGDEALWSNVAESGQFNTKTHTESHVVDDMLL